MKVVAVGWSAEVEEPWQLVGRVSRVRQPGPRRGAAQRHLVHSGHLTVRSEAARVEPLDAAGGPASLELEAVFTKGVAQVDVGNVAFLERRVEHIRVLFIRCARVLGRSDEARGRRGESGPPEQIVLVRVQALSALRDAPAPLVEEAIVLGRVPVAAVDARIHEHLGVQRLRLLALGGAQAERGDQMATRAEAKGGDRARAHATDAVRRGLEVIEAVIEAIVGQQPVPEHHGADAVLRKPFDHRETLQGRQKLVVAARAHDDRAASDHIGELRIHEHARIVGPVKERILRERRHPRPVGTLLTHRPPALRAGVDWCPRLRFGGAAADLASAIAAAIVGGR